MTDDTILSHAEALAEIRRLRADIDALDDIIIDQADAIERFRARITELEAAAAVTHGTLAKPTPADEPASFTGNLPPNAPPHNE